MLDKNPGHEALTERVIGSGIKIHEYFGPGLLESVYQRCMEIELQRIGLKIECDRRIPLVYEGLNLGQVFTPDLIVEDVLIVELKAIETIARVTITK